MEAAVSSADPTRGRWRIAAAAVLFQLALGAVYAWSVFAKALKAEDGFGLSKAAAALPFEVAIGCIFIGTFVGGRIQDRRGPKVVALVGGVLYSLGVLGASLATSADQLWLLVLTYGVLGGVGLGLGYIVPIAMLQKWFPDKRALITGIAVGGFGFGAVLTSPIAQRLVDTFDVPTRAFLPLGLVYLVLTLAGASQFRNPPAGYTVPGFVPSTSGPVVDSGRDYSPGEALRTPQWYLLTAILALNTLAGISLISIAADAASDIAGYTATAAAGLVGLLGLANGGGRILWAWIGGRIGKMPAFVGMLGLQGGCFLLLPHASSAALFALLAVVIYLCYGGGFGTMPSTAGDFFGVKNSGAIYGLMIVAWSFGGVVGPLIVSTLSTGGAYTRAFTTIAVVALAACVLPLVTRMPRVRQAPDEGYVGATADVEQRARVRG
jgi:OFA family oxalate/formate antiporter-like MFS transporter